MSRQRTRAPRRTAPLSMLIRSRPGTRRRSTSSFGAARRNAMVGMRLWPPAIAFAVPPLAASSAIASASVAGDAYSKGGSFIGCALFGLDAGGLHHLRPARDLGAHVRGQLRGRAADR